MHVQRVHVEAIAQNRETAVDLAAAVVGADGVPVVVRPKDAARGGIQSEDVILRTREVHDAIHHQRRGFELLRRAALKEPLGFQFFHIAGVDLIEAAVTPAVVAAGIHQPVAGFLIGVQQAFIGDGQSLRDDDAGGRKSEDTKHTSSHRVSRNELR